MYKLHSGSLYSYSNGVYCGVLVDEKVMKKLSSLQTKHLEDVKRLLTNSKGRVFPSMWTLHYPNDIQTNVHFIDGSASLGQRINLAVVSNKPRHMPTVFIAESMDEAKEMADERFLEAGQPDV